MCNINYENLLEIREQVLPQRIVERLRKSCLEEAPRNRGFGTGKFLPGIKNWALLLILWARVKEIIFGMHKIS